MLILERRIGENVVMGDEICKVTVLSIKGRTVKLGFAASKDLAIHRQEIYDIVKREKRHKQKLVQKFVKKAA